MTRFCLPLLPSYFGASNAESIAAEKVIHTVRDKLKWDSLRTLETPESELLHADAPCSGWAACEVWLDYVEGDLQGLLTQLLETHRDRVVFLFRRLQLEGARLKTDVAAQLIDQIVHKGGWLDLDVATQTQETAQYVKVTRQNPGGARLIASYHNYEATPSLSELKEIIESMRSLEPEVYKLATFCQTRQDALHLLTLLNLMREQGMKAIVLGMGVHGLVTRIVGTIWGNYLCFAPESLGTASAPGQLTYYQMQNILNSLESGAQNAG